MKQRVLVAFLTVLVFAAGFAARAWTEGMPALPPPPPMGIEFAPPVAAARVPAADAKKPADRRAQIIADIEKLGPQIALYRAKMVELEAGFDRDFSSILNDAQRQRRTEAFAAFQKKRAEKAMNGPALNSTAPLSDEEIERGLRTPLALLLAKVTVSEKLKRLTEANNLDAGQQVQARSLLLEYRERFLALVDSVPPTSFRMSELAKDVQKLSLPNK